MVCQGKHGPSKCTVEIHIWDPKSVTHMGTSLTTDFKNLKQCIFKLAVMRFFNCDM